MRSTNENSQSKPVSLPGTDQPNGAISVCIKAITNQLGGQGQQQLAQGISGFERKGRPMNSGS